MSSLPFTISSQSAPVISAAYFFAAISIGFGINAILRPAHGLSFFELPLPAGDKAARATVESLMVVYGVRDIFMGAAMAATAAFGTPAALGWILIAGSGVAVADGLVCYGHGKGQWNHWGHAPLGLAVGLVLLGLFD
ncbi:hypothetical protein BJ166DRAFT_497557 [Pestalotiopsis sp. NC0098]|nr:hypothetical protein BJ166DRAFT_497557 [Pestalotiopsis sp. NC0098]